MAARAPHGRFRALRGARLSDAARRGVAPDERRAHRARAPRRPIPRRGPRPRCSAAWLALSTGPTGGLRERRSRRASSPSSTPFAGVEVSSLRDRSRARARRLRGPPRGAVDATPRPSPSLNTALHEDGAVVFVAPGARWCRTRSSTSSPRRTPRAGPRAYPRDARRGRPRKPGPGRRELRRAPRASAYFTNAVTEVRSRTARSVEHYKLQQESEAALHVGRSLAASVGREGRASRTTRSRSARACRATTSTSLLAGEGAACVLEGLFVVDGDRHHRRPHPSRPRARRTARAASSTRESWTARRAACSTASWSCAPGAQKTDAVAEQPQPAALEATPS